MLDDKRHGRVAAPAVIEASSRVQGPSLAAVALEGKTDTVTPVAIEVHAGVIAREITDMQVVQRVERSSGRRDPLAEARANDLDRQHYTTFRYLCWLAGAGPVPFR